MTALVTPQGTVAGQYSYSPYGEESTTGHTRGQTITPAFGYAGMVYDQSTGLNLTLYRAYDPKLRRWLSRDPVGMMSGLALIRAGLAIPVALGGSGARWVGLNLAINRYPCVGNDPLNWGDPNGELPRVGPWLRIGCMVWAFCGSHRVNAPAIMKPFSITRRFCKLK